MPTLTCLPSPSVSLAAPRVPVTSLTSVDQEDSILRALEPTHDPDYGRLPCKAKDKFLAKLSAMVVLERSANKTAAANALERTMTPQMGRGFSAQRLLNDLSVWVRASKDWRVLVDAALAPGFRRVKRSHGVLAPKFGDGCQVPAKTADWWIQKAEDNQRVASEGWREVQRLWELSWADAETRIPGYGSAREYWARVKPSLLSQTTCPPDLPRGWSRSTYYAKMPAEWQMAVARVGAAYARGLLPGVPATRKGARYMEWVFFDDKWHEIYVVVDGVITPCRLLELGALDYATGEYIVWGFRPELPSENEGDARQRIKEEDMKWLVAALFQQEGYPRDYDCHLICERGTATLRDGPARALFDLSGGRIKTCYTEMQGGCWLIWEDKKRGNSKGKASLESFHNLTKNMSGALPGQTGVDHERQPATLPTQLRETRDLLTLAALMPAEDRQKLQHSLLRYSDATAALSAIYRRANERIEHNLEGIERDVVGWRMDQGHPFTWSNALPAEVHALTRVPGFEVRTRKASPVELKHRLKEGAAFLQFPEWALPLFFDHTQKVAKIEGLEWSFTKNGDDFVFWPDDNDPGALSMAAEMERRGERLCGYYNDRQPDRIYLTREDGGFFATWNRVQRASRADRERHGELRARVERRARFARRNPERRAGAEQARLLAQSFENGALLQKAGVLPSEITTVAPGARTAPGADLANVIKTDRQEQRRQEVRTARRNRARIIPTETFSADEQSDADHPIPETEAPAAENGEGFVAGVVQHQPNRPTRRRILAAEDFC